MIPIRQVHELIVGSSDRAEHPDHVSAASSLVRHAGLLLVVADDELSLIVFDEKELGAGHLIDILEGELPDDPDARKEEKPDLESLALLPPFGDLSHGALLAVGSGSSDKRMRGAVVPLGRNGHPVGAPRTVDLSELYDGLGREVKDLNIEGCAALGDRIYLAQRGNAADSEDALIALDWDAFSGHLASGSAPTVDAIVDIKTYDLGRLRGVDLSFSDLSPIEDGRLAFSSSAEDSGDTIGDGEIYGSALGILRPGGDIEYQEPVDGLVKIEGIDARIDDRGIEVLIVMDADDPSRPSPLLGATII
jgi:hypothetical protein